MTVFIPLYVVVLNSSFESAPCFESAAGVVYICVCVCVFVCVFWDEGWRLHHRKHSSPIAQLNVTLWPRIKCFSGAEYHGRLCLLRRAPLCSALHLAETSAEEEGGAQEPGGAELMRKVAERVAQGIPPEDLNETPQERAKKWEDIASSMHVVL